ncbi:hypothetical protein [Sewage-associated circular DNA virus-7]|uniref:Uncharacterized protein n=1 Tax=Sewage-associated circular DNA virus-7 TaxID=1519396 RepID=A0A075IZN8_9VIRU|nr:hypothetical protein [Sewage-associated circular DNA virus-7]
MTHSQPHLLYKQAIPPKKYLNMTWQEGKESTGCSPSPTRSSRRTYPRLSPGFADNSNSVLEGTSIGRPSWRSARRVLWPRSKQSSAPPCMPKSPDPLPPVTTFGRKILESPEPSSSSESGPSNATIPETGMPSGKWPLPAISVESPLVFGFRVIGLCGPSALTIRSRLEWSELASYSGVVLGLESLAALGTKPVWTLTLRIQTQNFGVGTMVRETLLSMNLEEESMSLTSSDGSTAIQSTWKLKEAQLPSVVNVFGSHPI